MLDMEKLEVTTREIIYKLYSKCDTVKVYINEDDVVIVEIKGGLNGRGKWEKYFADLSAIVSALKTDYSNVWLTELSIDVADDIWYAYLGVR